MVEKIADNIYRIEVPLPDNPLRGLNSYLLQGNERNLLIDTGFNRAECKEALERGFEKIGCSMDNTDIFITHLHGDHSGLTGYLARQETKIYTGKYSAKFLMYHEGGVNFPIFILQSGLAKMGMSPDDTSIHQGYKYASSNVKKINTVADGDIIDIGTMSLQCIDTPGHTPDHMCLYIQDKKILFSGDHILGNITPNIAIWKTPWEVDIDYLGDYLKNLDRISLWDVTLVLPGHRDIFTDCARRIKELKIHHQMRLDSILKILGNNKKMSGAEIASQMRWNLKARSWDEFPPAQKYFATGEALSHLTHLIFKNILIKELQDGVVYYSKLH
jgi:glyoxylase-like metal-dependent hydrolase (beta-lactamase superfamily II)